MESRIITMDKNDIVEIEITGMTDEGSGVGRCEGIAVFVPYTITGEKVQALIIKKYKSYAIGKLLSVITPSEHRVKSDCQYFYKCGGCQLRHMDYKSELVYKKEKVYNCIKRIAGLNVDINDIEDVVSCDDTNRYRNKIQLPVSEGKIGFYRNHSHDIIDIDDCLLQSENATQIVGIIREWQQGFDVSSYDENTKNGLLRHIYLREGKSGVLVVLVVTDKDIPHKKELVDKLTNEKFKVCGITLNINSDDTNVVLGNEFITVWGDNYIIDSMGDREFVFSPNSFYQINNKQTKKLYDIAKKLSKADKPRNIWDIYCGIGTIGQYIANKDDNVIGIEIVPGAVKNAENNAKRNNISSAKYYSGSAEKLIPRIAKENEKPDVIILDPPRKGCDVKLLSVVADAKPDKIIYISCKPSTLARDIKHLSDKGYNPQKIIPVDMFPGTCHVETVALLCK